MELFELLQKIVVIFEHLQIPYLVTGSVASMAYGEPRLTNDIDVVAGIEEQHVADLLKAFPADEFYISENMVREAIHYHGQFNIIHPASGLKVDVIIKQNTPFDSSRFKRVHHIDAARQKVIDNRHHETVAVLIEQARAPVRHKIPAGLVVRRHKLGDLFRANQRPALACHVLVYE